MSPFHTPVLARNPPIGGSHPTDALHTLTELRPGEEWKTRLVDDALDVSRHYDLIAQEADLVMRLMDACNGHVRPLTCGEIDAALGLPSRLRSVQLLPRSQTST